MAVPPGWMRRLGSYALALLFVAAAAALRWALPGVLGPTPFLAFYLAWVGAATFGGLGPGLLATVASWLCLEVLFDFTAGQTILNDPTELGRFIVLLAGGLTVSLVAEAMRRGRIRERESEAQLRTVVENLTEGLVAADLGGRVFQWNRAALEMHGFASLAEAQRRLPEFAQIFELSTLEGTALPLDQWPLARVLRGEDLRDWGVRVRRIAGGSGERIFSYGGSLVRDEQGQPLLAVLTITDITERKRAEEALRELNAALESRVAQRTAELLHRTRQLQKLTLELSETEDRERKRMAEILHDDLQQVLAAAKFHVSLMRNRAGPDAALQATATRIDQMLKDAIDKSRSLSHELSPAVMHHGDLAEILRWLANQVRAKHGLVVNAHAQDPMHLQSEALKGFLYKAAQELLFNVVKHAQAKEAILRVRYCHGHICLSISDRGRGFDPQELRNAAGFGLLNIRERVELLGGQMRIRSVRGRGSRFLIVVPDTAGEKRAGSEEGQKAAGRLWAPNVLTFSSSSRPGVRRLRVLLADDHEIVRQGLISLLREEDAVEVVGEATNGREAVDLADRLHPDVVIMDMSMPVMSGDEATRQIKSQSPQIRVVALSMFEDAQVREKMRQAGAESYVLKTAPAEELVAAIRGQRGKPREGTRPA